MGSTQRNVVFATILATSVHFATASPAPQYSGEINTNMPFLTVSSTWPAVQAAASSASEAAASTSSAVSPQTTSAYENPFTIYTTMTNSLGVITGMPAVDTSIPSQAPVATICSGCASVLSDQASWRSSVAALTTTSTSQSVSTTMSSSTVSGSRSATSSGVHTSKSTGAASKNSLAGSSAALLAVGAFAVLL